tara:strand:- start:1677 stop:2009 length:333 start_codon:yes stop_codon:yes gene_type:complete
MIDIDKYEGHTEGPWKHVYQPWGGIDYIMSPHEDCVAKIDNGDKSSAENRADALLVADAPLLLEEVKRLRPMADELIAIWEILEEDYPQVDRAIVKELIERKIGDYEVIE